MSFLVATNVVASRPPERRPTGTPHARAKRFFSKHILGSKILGSKLSFGSEKIMVQKYFDARKFWYEIIFSLRNIK